MKRGIRKRNTLLFLGMLCGVLWRKKCECDVMALMAVMLYGVRVIWRAWYKVLGTKGGRRGSVIYSESHLRFHVFDINIFFL